jgi:transposase-like protein
MPWVIQLEVEPGAWREIHPSGEDTPYSYPTEEEANRVMEMCYPDECLLRRLGVHSKARTKWVQQVHKVKLE